MADLNPQQRAAVRHLGTPMLVLAGAGSGKTRVITHKIAWLVGEAGLPGKGVYAVTFTNKAAREMKERAAKALPAEQARGISVSTFHTLGLQILRSDGHALGYRRGFTIMDATDSLTAIKELVRSEGGSNLNDEDDLRRIISGWKNDFVTAEQAPATAQNEIEARAAKVYARYEQLLHAYNAVDFDDLIIAPVRVLTDHAEVRERWQNRVRHLLVDECQDTNGARLPAELAGHASHRRRSGVGVGPDENDIVARRMRRSRFHPAPDFRIPPPLPQQSPEIVSGAGPTRRRGKHPAAARRRVVQRHLGQRATRYGAHPWPSCGRVTLTAVPPGVGNDPPPGHAHFQLPLCCFSQCPPITSWAFVPTGYSLHGRSIRCRFSLIPGPPALFPLVPPSAS